MEKFKINKQKCIGCRICLQVCPGATEIGEDGKAEIINQEKLEQCGGESVCPVGAIEKVTDSFSYQPRPFGGRGLGRRMGRGLGKGHR